MKNYLFVLAALACSAGAWASSCYTVLNASGEVVNESSTPPVDMSKPLHATVPERFGKGATLVFGETDSADSTDCDAVVAGKPSQAVIAAELTPKAAE